MGPHHLREEDAVPTIRTTNEPEQEREVSDLEAEHLERIGLLLHSKATTDEGARRAAVNQTASQTEESDQ